MHPWTSFGQLPFSADKVHNHKQTRVGHGNVPNFLSLATAGLFPPPTSGPFLIPPTLSLEGGQLENIDVHSKKRKSKMMSPSSYGLQRKIHKREMEKTRRECLKVEFNKLADMLQLPRGHNTEKLEILRKAVLTLTKYKEKEANQKLQPSSRNVDHEEEE